MATQARKHTQRQRLLRGMVEATNDGGYPGANVSAVIGQAGVSRPTFYDYFADRDDCFRATIEEVQGGLLADVREALAGEPAPGASRATVQALVSYAREEPAQARFLMAESLAGGVEALDARDAGIAQIAEAIESAQAGVRDDERLVDLDARVLVASVYRMLAARLRRGEPAISKLSDELAAWLAAYERPAAEARWQTLAPGPTPARSPYVPEVPIQRKPDVFGPGRPRLPEEEIAENQRLRILYAAARMAVEKGFSATTVADITRLASVDGRVFYRHFSDKQDAFTAVHELGFQQVMQVTAQAFFAAEGWPQRSWEAGRALTQLLAANPLVARVGFVEAYAVGAAAVQRIEDSHTAFMFFLQEGLVHSANEPPPSRVAMEAIIGATFEIIYLRTRLDDEPQIAAMLPHIAHIWLTPFLGATESDAFIDAQMRSPRARTRPSRHQA